MWQVVCRGISHLYLPFKDLDSIVIFKVLISSLGLPASLASYKVGVLSHSFSFVLAPNCLAQILFLSCRGLSALHG